MLSTRGSITTVQWSAYRAKTFRLRPRLRLRNENDAVRFVDERGFVYLWPIKGVDLPSLWTAVAGDRPVADAHDDPGHVTWGWKDRMLGARKWFYAKALRAKATMISLGALKYFYALSENYGELDSDYLIQYDEGRLTQEAKQVFQALLEKGPLDSVALRKEARMAGKDRNPRFDRALTELQVGMKILPVGVSNAGAWHYCFIYEIVDRHFPDLAAQARPIGRGEARAHLADLYLRSVGAATEAQVGQLFRWRPEDTAKAVQALLNGERARRAQQVGGRAGDWLVSREML